jgi:hypothetical protein
MYIPSPFFCFIKCASPLSHRGEETNNTRRNNRPYDSQAGYACMHADAQKKNMRTSNQHANVNAKHVHALVYTLHTPDATLHQIHQRVCILKCGPNTHHSWRDLWMWTACPTPPPPLTDNKKKITKKVESSIGLSPFFYSAANKHTT